MKKTRRTTQVGDVIRAELAGIIRREMNDPALQLLTITDVELSTDLRHARIFVSSLQDEKQDEAVDHLRKHSSKLRYELGRRASLRYTPELDFRSDRTAKQASSIEKILHEVIPPESESDERDDD